MSLERAVNVTATYTERSISIRCRYPEDKKVGNTIKDVLKRLVHHLNNTYGLTLRNGTDIVFWRTSPQNSAPFHLAYKEPTFDHRNA